MAGGRPILVLILLALFVGSAALYTVDEREHALKLRFGEIVDADIPPGLHFKLPVVNTVNFYPRRLLTIINPQEQFLTFEKKNLVVDFFVKWRIVDVSKYYRATGGEEIIAAQRLLEIVKDGIRGEFAKRTVPEVVSAERRNLMDNMLNNARSEAERFGIDVVDVRVKRIEFPEEVSDSVFNRMRQERKRFASKLRAEGVETAEEIRADADRQATVIVAEAYRDAEKIRGEGDALAANVYAQAFEQDPEFFSFYRSIQAYKTSVGSGNDMLVLDADSDFLRYLNNKSPSR
ncbi:MAG: protease modulator HflC [Chromatiales bacterium]|nr:MAG: protease modulator HflC [Chromatiales bacterium]